MDGAAGAGKPSSLVEDEFGRVEHCARRAPFMPRAPRELARLSLGLLRAAERGPEPPRTTPCCSEPRKSICSTPRRIERWSETTRGSDSSGTGLQASCRSRCPCCARQRPANLTFRLRQMPRAAADGQGLMHQPLDLSYMGVQTIWANDLGKVAQTMRELRSPPFYCHALTRSRTEAILQAAGRRCRSGRLALGKVCQLDMQADAAYEVPRRRDQETVPPTACPGNMQLGLSRERRPERPPAGPRARPDTRWRRRGRCSGARRPRRSRC